MQFMSHDPLSKAELQELQQFLIFPHDSAVPLHLIQAHGFMSALITAPHLIMPSKWHPLFFGGQPTFDSLEHANYIFALMARLNNQTSSAFIENRFEPIIFTQGEVVPYSKANLEQIGEWCSGYIKATEIDPLWLYDATGRELFKPLLLLGALIELKQLGSVDDQVVKEYLKENKNFREQILKAARDLYDYWEPYRRKGIPVYGNRPPRPFQPRKVSRNDFCPCGSGKKYKKCCADKSPLIH
jgi:uncharacterized protein